MKGYRLDHKNFNFMTQFSESIHTLRDKPHLICKVNIDSLYARIVTGYQRGKAKHKLVRLRETPHYAFIMGDERSYRQYLERYGRDVGYAMEHSEVHFRQLIASEEAYLEGKYKTGYIVCETVSTLFLKRTVILDGVHRAIILLSQGVENLPVALITDEKKSQFHQYLTDYKDDFLEWYTPVQINDTIIHERTYPDFKERPEYLDNRERGKSKWDFIIKKNLPALGGKKVCDIGCNIGLYSLYLSQSGASQVDGYDRHEGVVQPTNPHLPRQNVIQQAYFVKNLFKQAKMIDNNRINFMECDIATLDFSKMRYDLLFSCCVLYHFKEKFEQIIKGVSGNIPEIFLQTNLGHEDVVLAEYVSLDYHEKILGKYGYDVTIDAPEGYKYPVIYGKKKGCLRGEQFLMAK